MHGCRGTVLLTLSWHLSRATTCRVIGHAAPFLPWVPPPVHWQVYKRLTAALLLGAEVATATGTAHPPPLLRRLQVGGGRAVLCCGHVLASLELGRLWD